MTIVGDEVVPEELSDMRLRADGILEKTAGAALRKTQKGEAIIDKAITSRKTSFREINKDKNLLDLEELFTDKYWHYNGNEVANTVTNGTRLIDCSGKTKLVYNNYGFFSFYDAAGVWISGFTNANIYMQTNITNIPANACFFRSSINKTVNSDYNSLFIITSNDSGATVANLANLRKVEYSDKKLVIDDENLKYINPIKKTELLDVNISDLIVLPTKIFATSNELLSWTNTIMLSKKYVDIKVSYATGANEWGKRSYNFDEFNWSIVPNNTVVTVFISSDGILKYTKNIVVFKTTNIATPKAVNTIHIGDSLTNRGLASAVKNYLSIHYAITQTSIGTMINDNSQRGEGREGWLYSNFIGKKWITRNGGTIVAATGVTNNQLLVNPFLKVATTNDLIENPDYCFAPNGISYIVDKTQSKYYIFDFSNYLTVQGLTVPDVITIALSTNDILNGSTTYVDDCKKAMVFMIKKIREAAPTVKIGILPTFNFGMGAIGNLNQIKALRWTKECISIIDSLSDVRCYTIPSYLSVDRLTAFPFSTEEPKGENNLLESTVNDTVHTNAINQHGNVVAQWIANII